MSVIRPVRNLEDANKLAQAIVNTIPEPFLVLDADLRVLEASRSFYEIFQVEPAQTQDCLLYDLGHGQWDIPALRVLLETVLPERVAMDGFEVDNDFPGIGHRIMLLNARKVLYDESDTMAILLAFRDCTERRVIEREKAALLEKSEMLRRQNEVLLQEMRHRVGNSLQIIASILLLKARAVPSDETRFHLHDAHQRVMSVAAVQQHLDMTDGIDQIDVGIYLEKLCAGLGTSMVGDDQPVAITVASDTGMIPSAKAVSFGLIVTELVINALKYAFPDHKREAAITVSYAIDGDDWTLIVSDNGVGKIEGIKPKADGGFGTTIVAALAKQLKADVTMTTNSTGFTVTVASKAAAKPLLRAA
ncbi:sensor histidine kinase [Sphingomonas sp. 10B4]|uniref:sensor histidine kinase n=1 Tax=Sphingomonas sp. 10B4 TaxID=3048575 RepID=UPI002AB4B3A9|nr:histidine kinase dimerization/phosphoacceptor domain -containing protein [Sphingomonas sp. 10B4]MDY7522823.1 histidine kinase dimerization/phosphoacceptor domain -containing protein [Sphingomonas sp. 10B4]MEB0283846.1 histidine kinase dimerization/phosphoacceptor domain -containing protein [Sphingomonas sp. 10B4]